MPNSDQAVYVFATITPKREYIEDVGNALEELIEPTLAEPGCRVFSAFRNQADEGVFHLFEIFESEEAIQSHYAQQYTTDVFSQYEKWLAAPVSITKLSPNSDQSTEQFV